MAPSLLYVRRNRRGKTVTVAGIITSVPEQADAIGEAMAFVTIEDRYADMELIVFPKVLGIARHLLVYENAIAATGELGARRRLSRQRKKRRRARIARTKAAGAAT